MGDYFGKIDLDRLPDRETIWRWEREAKQVYKASCNRSFERFQMEYVNDRIIEWQRLQRERDNIGRRC